MSQNSPCRVCNVLHTRILIALLTLSWPRMAPCAAPQKDYPIRPVPFTAVVCTDEFWAPRIETNRAVSIPYAFGKCEETGRMDNFAIAAGRKTGRHRGDFPFDDTDPYKILEGAAYALNVRPDPKLDAYLDDLIDLIAAAQEADGYLYTCRTNKAAYLMNWSGPTRWSKLDGSHELYNMGHLYEAAVAHFEATGKRSLLDVATKNADFLLTVFGPGKNGSAPGHQIIEMGLARLYRATGNEQYLQLAKFFLDTRGPGRNSYHQSHKKPVDQDEAVGHAVRASYMYCGMADVAALTGDTAYLAAIDRLWDNVVSKKLYITGGIGARGSGEAFGDNYELPNESAYCETCAAIGNVMWNQRMFGFHGHARYIDVLERTLYNALIAGVSLEGDRFFYPNPLASSGQHQRSPWFGCACCPGNITRFIASVPGYVYAVKGDTLYVNLYVQGKGKTPLDCTDVTITQTTRYPWDGKVTLTVTPEKSGEFTLALRIPGWAHNEAVPSDLYRFASAGDETVALSVNGKPAGLNIKDGFAVLRRDWMTGDTVELTLPMHIQRVLAHDAVEADRGRVALQRGPIVYCAEWPDNDGEISTLVLPDETELTCAYRSDLLKGVAVITGKAVGLEFDPSGNIAARKPRTLTAIPYYAWAHRGPGQMAVWLARDEKVVEAKLPPGTLANPSFERGSDNRPTGFRTQTYSGDARFEYAKTGRTGDRCVMIESTAGADAGWFGSFTVKPNTRYRLSVWIKAENLDAGSGKGALLNIHNIQPLQSSPVTGTTDWTNVSVEFDSASHRTIEFNCLFGGWGRSTGRAFYDDLEIEEIASQ